MPWLPWQHPPFWFFQPLKSCHTLRLIFLQSLMKFDERNKKKKLIPLFLFSWQLRRNLSNRFRFFWLILFHWRWLLFLSRFINFCLASNLLWSFLCFSLFSILAVSMAMAAISLKSTIKGTTSHGICYSYKVS